MWLKPRQVSAKAASTVTGPLSLAQLTGEAAKV